MKINAIRPQDNKYLEQLDSIALTPNLLYYYGNWPEKRIKTVAIVGARKSTAYGEEIAYKLAKALGEQGIIVISGLAYGIDSIAARGCLDGGGKTIAILGTEIERIYPKTHVALAEEIVKKGGVVASEYHLGDKIFPKTSFLERNRIISGLSDVVVVIEARERSGSLNTAMHALEQGKDLFALPGDISRQTSQGCNRLISKGANPLLSVEEFMTYLMPKKKARSKQGQMEQISLFAGNDEEREILLQIANGVHDGDVIMENLKMPAETFNQSITMLEIKGAVTAMGMNYWSLS